MKPGLIDRLLVISIAAAVIVCLVCQVMLWAWAFDPAGSSMLITLAATMLAVWFAIGLPGRVARIARWILLWVDLRDMVAARIVAASFPSGRSREGRAMMRLLGASSIFAGLCALTGAGAVYVGAAVADALTKGFLWSSPAWSMVKLLIQFAGTLPMALGMAVIFLVGSLVRSGSGRDIYASICRDWLWACGVALGVFSIAWSAGAHLLGLGAIAMVFLVAMGVALFQRNRMAHRPPRSASVAASPPRVRTRMGIIIAFAGLVLAMLIQGRLLGDLGGLHLGAQAGWTAISIFILVWFLRGVDHKSHPPGRGQAIGAVVGISAILVIQSALAMRYTTGGPVAPVCIILAASAQIPLAALAAILLSRQRRLFAAAGGRARNYVASAAFGAAMGMVCALTAGAIPSGRVVLLVSAMVLCGAGVAAGMGSSGRSSRPAAWTACGAALMASAMAAMLLSVRATEGVLGDITPGIWLTAGNGGAGGRQYLPYSDRWRSAGVTDALNDILATRTNWWILGNSRGDLPDALPPNIRLAVSAADTASVAFSAWEDIAEGGVCGDFFQATQAAGREEFFDGILLTGLAGDHHDAWRCYSLRTVARVASRLLPGGALVIRTQVGRDGLDTALSMAATVDSCVGPAWLVARIDNGRLDILLAGPVDEVPKPRPREGIFVVSTDRLLQGRFRIPSMRLLRPNPGTGRISPSRLQYWLRCAQEAS